MGGLDHGTLGVEAVNDEPQGPAAAAQLLGGPGDLRRGLVQLGVEVGAAVGVDLGQVGVADVQLAHRGRARVCQSGWRATQARVTQLWPYRKGLPAGPGVGLWWRPAPSTHGP